MPFVELVNRRGHGFSGVSFDGIRIRASSRGQGSKYGTSIVIQICEKTCREYRLTYGDRVKILIDPDSGMALLKRCLGQESSGWMVTKVGGDTAKVLGKYGIAHIKFTPDQKTFDFFFPFSRDPYSAESVTVKDEGILFDTASVKKK